MDHREVGRYWDENAEAWTALVRAGYDTYRDGFNTPAFLEMLPRVEGLRGLDIGCGEGHNTRLVAARGARMTGIDISARFVGHAREMEATEPRGIEYVLGSAVELPFADGSFAFATAFMSLMDIADPGAAIQEAWRVLAPGGFLQFSIEHPCFDTLHRRNLRDEQGMTYAIEVGGYFERPEREIEEWTFKAAPAEARAGLRPFRVPRFRRTVSEWMNMMLDAGFAIERVNEPRPDDEAVRRFPNLQDAQVVAYFLHVRGRTRDTVTRLVSLNPPPGPPPAQPDAPIAIPVDEPEGAENTGAAEAPATMSPRPGRSNP